MATSTHGIRGVGWPSKIDPNWRYVIISSSEIAPAARNIAYRSVDAWPFEKTSRSFDAASGTPKSYCRCFASSTDIRSAADIPEVGCPDFAAAAQRTESTRNCCPSSRQS